MQPRVIAMALTAILTAACRGGQPPGVVIHTRGGPVRVAVELANTPETRTRGLMYRTALADDHGMLFVFAEESVQAFWMKNTYIPLDMVFIAADGHVAGIRSDTTPLSTTPIGIDRPSRYVLEVPAGYTRRRGIAPGDRVDLPPLP